MSAESRPKSAIERLLSPIAEVHRSEAVSALLMTLLMFLLLAAYYLLKTAREVFILTGGGAEIKSYSSAGQAFLLLGLVPAYGAFASRVNRVRLVTWVTLFFASHLVLFVLAIRAGLNIGIVYFLWVGIFNLMAIAQFWGFATDLYTKEQGKRLFPLIGVGSSLGAWVGSVTQFGAGPESGAARERFVGESYSRLFSTVNLVGFLMQMFVVSRIFKFLGVGKSLFIHPTVAFIGYLMMLRAPSVQLMGWLKIADNSLDYSLGNTNKQALWLPTSREAKYKAKQAVDSFFVRAGDVIQAAIVFAGERLLLTVPGFAAINLVLTAAWLAVVGLLNVTPAEQPASAPVAAALR